MPATPHDHWSPDGANPQRDCYRKSRKFGDIYGGRVRPRVPDNIFRRAHSLNPPGPLDQTPILIEDNPSRNFFFPLSAEESLEAVNALPKKVRRGPGMTLSASRALLPGFWS